MGLAPTSTMAGPAGGGENLVQGLHGLFLAFSVRRRKQKENIRRSAMIVHLQK